MSLISSVMNAISGFYLTIQTTFATPPSGKVGIFAKADGLYLVNSSGTVTGPIGGLSNPMTTAGDLIVGGVSGVPSRLGMGAASKVLAVNSGGTALEWAVVDYICIQDQKTAGTAGGSSTSGSFLTRVLNTEVSDTGNHASISNNQITLAAGTYDCHIWSTFYASGPVKIKLRNITDNSDILIGLSVYGYAAGSASPTGMLTGRFTLAAQKVIELQYRVTTSGPNEGLGVASNFGVIEIYSSVELWKVA